MNRHTRRSFMRFGGMLVLLTGCSTLANITTSQLQTDLQTIDAAAIGFLNALGASGVTLPAGVLSQVQTVLTAIENNAQAILTAISQGMSVTSVSGLFSALQSAVAALVPLLSTFFPQASLIGAAIQAFLVLAQAIASEAGVVTAPAPTAGALSSHFAAAVSMPVDTARKTLAGLAA